MMIDKYSKVFGRALSPKENRVGLIMELSPCHKPRWKDLIRTTFSRKSLLEAKLERYEQRGLVKKTLMNASAPCGGSCKKCKGCNHENAGNELV